MKKHVLLVTTFLNEVQSETFDLIGAIVLNGLTHKFYFQLQFKAPTAVIASKSDLPD